MSEAPDRWWEMAPHRWAELIEPEVLDLHHEESKGLIRFLEQTTGKVFSESRFKAVLDLVNETETWFLKARDLLARTRPAPIAVSDTFTSVMMPQWHRGTPWARDMARMFYEEMVARVDAGAAAWPDEKIRLAWLGQGIWFNVDFYEAFQKDYGAVFVWSMYLGYAADAYIRYGEDDLLRTLSARYSIFTAYMAMEPWPSGWFVKEAKLSQCDGVVVLGDAWPFVDQAFEEAGIPLLRLKVHQVDSRQWDEARVTADMRTFIEQKIQPNLR